MEMHKTYLKNKAGASVLKGILELRYFKVPLQYSDVKYISTRESKESWLGFSTITSVCLPRVGAVLGLVLKDEDKTKSV